MKERKKKAKERVKNISISDKTTDKFQKPPIFGGFFVALNRARSLTTAVYSIPTEAETARLIGVEVAGD